MVFFFCNSPSVHVPNFLNSTYNYLLTRIFKPIRIAKYNNAYDFIVACAAYKNASAACDRMCSLSDWKQLFTHRVLAAYSCFPLLVDEARFVQPAFHVVVLAARAGV